MGLYVQYINPTVIYCYNKSFIKIFDNIMFHGQSKHIYIWYHHLRHCVRRRIMLLPYILVEEQDVDILTKGLSSGNFEFHRYRIRVVANPFLAKSEC